MTAPGRRLTADPTDRTVAPLPKKGCTRGQPIRNQPSDMPAVARSTA